MTQIIVLVDHLHDFTWEASGLTIMRTRDYLAEQNDLFGKSQKVINLSKSYRYLSYGYYASLLAETRKHGIIPSTQTILELNQRGSWQVPIQELELTLQRAMAQVRDLPKDAFTLTVFLGRPDDPRFRAIASKAFDLFRCPILRIRIVPKDDLWKVKSVTTLDPTKLHGDAHSQFGQALTDYTRLKWRNPKKRKNPRYNLAILHDPKEAMPPSDPTALATFQEVGEELGIQVEMIQKKDFSRLAEYDALFIRETTAIDHHTFRFAIKAEQEGMPVIDDPTSILRCTNKVFLAESLKRNRVPTPRTVVLDRHRIKGLSEVLSFPMVLKVPDGSFSRGMFKVENPEELKLRSKELFEQSDIILAQEFMYTDFDWRVGVLDGKPLYVSKYEMVRGHWQIYQHGENSEALSGDFETLAVKDAPKEVVKTALKASALMGNGLYGVDLKQNARGVFVVEVNDNPSIDSGVEDVVAGRNLYRTIIESFTQRIEQGRA